MSLRAFQDEMTGNICWGCGAANEHGLRIKSHWSDDEAVSNWQPKPYHAGGRGHALNGGIIASLIDCHSVCTAIAAAYRAEGRAIGSEPMIWYVTGSLQVSYLRPTPPGETVTLRARIKEMKERKTAVACSLFSGGEECARGEVLAVRVAPGGGPH
jgi:acyl-coenzyme A thioesterase PaaI-like protein